MGTRIKVLRQGVCCCRDIEVLRRGALISYAAGQEVSDLCSPDFAEIGGPGVKNGWARMDTYRLEQARERLRQRLIARGLTLPCGLGAILLLEGAAGATVPQALIGPITKAAITVAAGKAVRTVVTAKVAALTEGVLRTMFLTKIKIATVALVVGMMALWGGMLTFRTLAAAEPVGSIVERSPQSKGMQARHAVGQQKGAEKAPADLALLQSKDAKTDLERLHGAWTLVEMETRGKKLTGKNMTFSGAPLKSLKLAVDGEHFPDVGAIPEEQVTDPKSPRGGVDVQFGGHGPINCEFVLNQTKKPKQITMGGFPLNWQSIYKLEGNTLTICFNPKNHIRPDEFRTMADSDRVLFVFKRDAAEVQEKSTNPKRALPDAIKALNEKASKDPIGKDEIPISEQEVIAVIRASKRPKDSDVTDELYKAFKRIAETRQLPPGVDFEAVGGVYDPGAAFVYDVWWVRIKMPKEGGGTYAFEIRERLIRSRTLQEELVRIEKERPDPPEVDGGRLQDRVDALKARIAKMKTQ